MDEARAPALDAAPAQTADLEYTPAVLCVDDEPNILAALRRVLRHCGGRVLTAGGGVEALAILDGTPVVVVVSDMRMPGMDGVQFLEQVRLRWPDTVRILLTGHAEMSAAVAAINRGRIFRYLNKPWDDAELLAIVRQALELVTLQREKLRLEALTLRQNQELRELNETLERRVLDRTQDLAEANKKLKHGYLTSIKVFSNLLELRGGRLQGHGRRVAHLARQVAQAMGLDEQAVQDIFVAGLLHDIGHLGLPDSMLAKPVARMSAEELKQYRRHPQLGEQSLMALDDLQAVATLVHAHHERYDGRGYPDALWGAQIPLGARILAVVDTYDELQDGHLGGAQPSAEEARILLQQGRGTQFDPEILEIFLQVTQSSRSKESSPESSPLLVATDELRADMILATDLLSPEGVILLTAGHRLTTALIRRIRLFEERAEQRFRIHVQRPADERSAS
jgi:response regulator RpfG family c-di-GMP phosphodiesterase